MTTPFATMKPRPDQPGRRAPRTLGGIGGALAPIHTRWLAEVQRNLVPACDPHAGFWPRWDAVRYLADRFDCDFRLEGELLEALRGRLHVVTARRLSDDRQAIEALRRDLDRMGRRRGTGLGTSAVAGALLLTLERWFGDLEQALSCIPLESAPSAGSAALARLAQVRGHAG